MRNILLLLLLALLWSPSFLFIKIAVVEIPPTTLTALRIGSGAIALNLYLLLTGKWIFIKDKTFWKNIAFTAFFSLALPFFLINWGEQFIDSGLGSILNGLTPLSAMLFTILWVKTEKFNALRSFGVLLGFIGLIILTLPALSTGEVGSMLGILSVSAGAFSYGIGHTYTKIHLLKIPPLVVPASQLMVATLYLIPAAIIADGNQIGAPVSTLTIWAVLFLGVIGTALAFVVYYRLLDRTNSTFSSLVTYIIPVFAVAFGVLFLDEVLFVETIIGGGFILFSILIFNGWITKSSFRAFSRKLRVHVSGSK